MQLKNEWIKNRQKIINNRKKRYLDILVFFISIALSYSMIIFCYIYFVDKNVANIMSAIILGAILTFIIYYLIVDIFKYKEKITYSITNTELQYLNEILIDKHKTILVYPVIRNKYILDSENKLIDMSLSDNYAQIMDNAYNITWHKLKKEKSMFYDYIYIEEYETIK